MTIHAVKAVNFGAQNPARRDGGKVREKREITLENDANLFPKDHGRQPSVKRQALPEKGFFEFLGRDDQLFAAHFFE